MGLHNSTPPHRTPAIQAENLSKVYGTGEDSIVAVDGLDLTVGRGEVFGFLGPNGAGKSTTIDLLLGFATPSTGTASVLGMDVAAESEAIRSRIGVLPEGLGLWERLTGRRHLEFAIHWKDADDDPATLLERVNLDGASADRPVREYSKGMRQRLALAMALVGSPEVLVLDEPSSGLDPHGIQRLQEIVRTERDRGATVFFSSHILGQVEAVCDRVGILSEGTLVAVDSIDGLRKTVGSGTTLHVRVQGAVPVSLTDIDGVESVETHDGLIQVQTSDSTAKARVIDRLLRNDVTILDLDSTEASLEDLFEAYTNGSQSPGPTDGAAEQEAMEVPVS